jgi:cytochrome c-type biogenesis protein CcmH
MRAAAMDATRVVTWSRRFARCAAALAVALFAAFAPAPACAQGSDPAMDARLKKLESELRCLVCQNQTLADSDASLAGDLRREVRALAAAGKTDTEIKDYLVARYGDFVLYNPPVKSTTWLLWFGPLLLLVAGGAVWLAVVRRRRKGADRYADVTAGSGAAAGANVESPDNAIAKARQMLYEEP